MNAKEKQPFVVACVNDTTVKSALRQLDCRCQFVTSAKRILSTEYRQHPNSFVLQGAPGEVQQTVALIKSLRHQRPLADVLVWAPRASGPAVRNYLLAGAKDVVVGQSAAHLATHVNQTLQAQHLLPRVNDLSHQRNKSARFESMLSRSQAMWDLFELCARIAATEATVLIVGETGTGKELLARAVHRQSKRQGRFVAANCASIPAELVNSELFGHEKGAFTGADRAKQGLVRHAHEGTLFLDEIGDMPAEGQQSLLRMLQERRIRPVGSLVETKVDVRVIAATNVPLDLAVRDRSFREDLFYRLDVIRMNVPPLRDRHEDILFLFGHFTKKLSKHYGRNPPTYADSFLDALLEYEWPGNVRQLENFSERLVLASPHRALTARDFARLRTTSLAEGRQATSQQLERRTQIDTSKPLQEIVQPLIAQQEAEYLRAALTQNGGRIAATAAQAGISRRTLLRKMKLYGLEKEKFRRSVAT